MTTLFGDLASKFSQCLQIELEPHSAPCGAMETFHHSFICVAAMYVRKYAPAVWGIEHNAQTDCIRMVNTTRIKIQEPCAGNRMLASTA
jgi:hypothetical protein